MDVRPISTPQLDLDHLPLAYKDFQIKDTFVNECSLKLYYQYRDQYLNHVDKIGFWESNLPKYQFPEVQIFLEIVHYYHANYIPDQREVMSPNQTILFTIIVESINEMLQLQPGQNLTPLSIGDLLVLFPKLSPAILAQIIQTYIVEEKYTPNEPPLYVYTIFSPFGQDIVAMISSVLGYTTSEYIDDIILAFMSIYTPGQPPDVIYDYAKFTANRVHD